MKKSIETVYRCDHCTKISKSAGAMIQHEKYCKKNPEFIHPCFTCTNLVSKRVELESYQDDPLSGEPVFVGNSTSTEFICKKLGTYLHPKKSELSRVKEAAENYGEAMPKECEYQCFDLDKL